MTNNVSILHKFLIHIRVLIVLTRVLTRRDDQGRKQQGPNMRESIAVDITKMTFIHLAYAVSKATL